MQRLLNQQYQTDFSLPGCDNVVLRGRERDDVAVLLLQQGHVLEAGKGAGEVADVG